MRGPGRDENVLSDLQVGCKCRKNAVPARAGILMKPEVEIYDTTLRDGSQGEGINFSVADKLRIAESLDAFGVHYIEGGWPGSNPKDIEFFAEAKSGTSSMRVWPLLVRLVARTSPLKRTTRCAY